MASARRARLNGTLSPVDDGLLLEPAEAFTNCRKYVAPSEAVSFERHVGPLRRDAVLLTDAWLQDVIARCETSFLGSVSPEGLVDVSHRGGEPGFLELDGVEARWAGTSTWATACSKAPATCGPGGRFSLLVLDLLTGDAAELHGTAAYRTLRTAKEARQKRPRAETGTRIRCRGG